MRFFLFFIFQLFLLNMIHAQNNSNIETVTLGSGCFWCSEAIFSRVEGVIKVLPGYSGGHVKNPTYKEVCVGNTGHAEVVQISYNKNLISFTELLEIFFKTHNPTTLNRQGGDVGTQYRSVIFYHSEEQHQLAEKIKRELEDQHIWDDPIVTSVEPFTNFFEAEDYHHQYYNNNPNQGYCQFTITPKIEKFEKVFKEYLKK